VINHYKDKLTRYIGDEIAGFFVVDNGDVSESFYETISMEVPNKLIY
jgi:hypothetical protein